MRGPRISIAWLMVAVVVVAVDLAVLQWAFAMLRAWSSMSDSLWSMVLAFVVSLPMLNLLAIGLVLMRRRGRSRAFLLGFEVLGALAVAGCALDLGLWKEGSYTFRYVTALSPLWDRMVGVVVRSVSGGGPPRPDQLTWVPITALFTTIFCLPPQLLPALVGGWLSSRERVRLLFGRGLSSSGPGMGPP